jgi:hypothetical protein
MLRIEAKNVTKNFTVKTKNSQSRKFFAGTASYLRKSKISSLALFLVHFPAFIFAPIVLG